MEPSSISSEYMDLIYTSIYDKKSGKCYFFTNYRIENEPELLEVQENFTWKKGLGLKLYIYQEFNAETDDPNTPNQELIVETIN